MPGIVRKGDINTAGGVAVAGASSVIVNGRPVTFPGSPVTPHPCCGAPGCDIHCVAVVGMGTPTVIIEGKQAVPQGAIDICGHPRLTCSNDVIIPGASSSGGLFSAAVGLGISALTAGAGAVASGGPVAKAGSYNPALKS